MKICRGFFVMTFLIFYFHIWLPAGRLDNPRSWMTNFNARCGCLVSISSYFGKKILGESCYVLLEPPCSQLLDIIWHNLFGHYLDNFGHIITGNYWTFTFMSCFQKPTVGQFGASRSAKAWIQTAMADWRWMTSNSWRNGITVAELSQLSDPNSILKWPKWVGAKLPNVPSLDVAISGTRMR